MQGDTRAAAGHACCWDHTQLAASQQLQQQSESSTILQLLLDSCEYLWVSCCWSCMLELQATKESQMYSHIRLEIEFCLSYDEECLEVLDTPSNLWACSDIQALFNGIILISQPGDPYCTPNTLYDCHIDVTCFKFCCVFVSASLG